MSLRKRSLCLLLAMLLCLSFFPGRTFAEETPVEEAVGAADRETPAEEAAFPGDASEADIIEEEEADMDIVGETAMSAAELSEDVLVEEAAPIEEDAGAAPDERPVIIAFAEPELSQIREYRKPALCEVLSQLPDELRVRLGETPTAKAETDEAADPDAPIEEAAENPAALPEEGEWRTVPAVWECMQDYDEWLSEYDFCPVIEGCQLGEGVKAPVIRLTVEDLSIPECREWESGEESRLPIVGAGSDLRLAAPRYNAYELGMLPPIRNQNPYGTCWAHAAIGAVEADLIAGGQASPSSIDLSELHLIYFCKHTYTDPKGLNTEDWISEEYGRDFMRGGNGEEASLTMANMVGPVNEASAPYRLAESYAPSGTDAKSMNAAQMVGAYRINPADRDAIKEAILTHGSVTASMAAVDSYYSATHNSFCYLRGGTNHDVMLVGWDDSFSRDKFKVKPAGDGAWLVRNSWGGKGYSFFGYFWLSYEDGGLLSSQECWAFDAERQSFDNVYAYDSLPGLYWYTDVSAGDSVTQHFTVDNQESVEAVGIMLSAGCSVRIHVSDGARSASGSCSAPFEGFYLVRLNRPFTVSGGRKDITVTVSYDTEGLVFYEAGSSSYGGQDAMEAGCGSGGFVIHYAQYDWDQRMNDDVRIKLFTSNTGADREAVAAFVRRGYSLMLGREADADGLKFYVDLLTSGQLSGAQMVSNFMYSPEFSDKNYPSEQVVRIVYQTMLNREPDADGLRYHSANLDRGISYNSLINNFSGSEEFAGICGQSGITPGMVEPEWRERNPGVTAFVARNYELTLGRVAGGSELNYYCQILLEKTLTPQQVAHNFVFSPECAVPPVHGPGCGRGRPELLSECPEQRHHAGGGGRGLRQFA